MEKSRRDSLAALYDNELCVRHRINKHRQFKHQLRYILEIYKPLAFNRSPVTLLPESDVVAIPPSRIAALIVVNDAPGCVEA
jgi:hypothetical protein